MLAQGLLPSPDAPSGPAGRRGLDLLHLVPEIRQVLRACDAMMMAEPSPSSSSSSSAFPQDRPTGPVSTHDALHAVSVQEAATLVKSWVISVLHICQRYSNFDKMGTLGEIHSLAQVATAELDVLLRDAEAGCDGDIASATSSSSSSSSSSSPTGVLMALVPLMDSVLDRCTALNLRKQTVVDEICAATKLACTAARELVASSGGAAAVASSSSSPSHQALTRAAIVHAAHRQRVSLRADTGIWLASCNLSAAIADCHRCALAAISGASYKGEAVEDEEEGGEKAREETKSGARKGDDAPGELERKGSPPLGSSDRRSPPPPTIESPAPPRMSMHMGNGGPEVRSTYLSKYAGLSIFDDSEDIGNLSRSGYSGALSKSVGERDDEDAAVGAGGGEGEGVGGGSNVLMLEIDKYQQDVSAGNKLVAGEQQRHQEAVTQLALEVEACTCAEDKARSTHDAAVRHLKVAGLHLYHPFIAAQATEAASEDADRALGALELLRGRIEEQIASHERALTQHRLRRAEASFALRAAASGGGGSSGASGGGDHYNYYRDDDDHDHDDHDHDGQMQEQEEMAETEEGPDEDAGEEFSRRLLRVTSNLSAASSTPPASPSSRDPLHCSGGEHAIAPAWTGNLTELHELVCKLVSRFYEVAGRSVAEAEEALAALQVSGIFGEELNLAVARYRVDGVSLAAKSRQLWAASERLRHACYTRRQALQAGLSAATAATIIDGSAGSAGGDGGGDDGDGYGRSSHKGDEERRQAEAAKTALHLEVSAATGAWNLARHRLCKRLAGLEADLAKASGASDDSGSGSDGRTQPLLEQVHLAQRSVDETTARVQAWLARAGATTS